MYKEMVISSIQLHYGAWPLWNKQGRGAVWLQKQWKTGSCGTLVMESSLASAAIVDMEWAKQILQTEPSNALSLPTWSIHVASVVEWVVAMALVWEYGNTPHNTAWKGLTWAMVPLLGGAMCACTWHFFYNAPSLEILVVLQSALTLIGNCTLWLAAYRIFLSKRKNV